MPGQYRASGDYRKLVTDTPYRYRGMVEQPVGLFGTGLPGQNRANGVVHLFVHYRLGDSLAWPVGPTGSACLARWGRAVMLDLLPCTVASFLLFLLSVNLRTHVHTRIM